jgi:hypothetical protein
MYRALGLLCVIFSGNLGMAIEEPPYEIELKMEDYEIRRYQKIIVAETLVQADFEDAGNAAFRILADFIFGKNQSQSKIAMTSPVTQQPSSERISMTAPVTQTKMNDNYLVQFVMPKEYTLDSLPQPLDSRITIREVPARRIAVHQYSGGWSEAKYQKELAKFLAVLAKDKVETVGEPTLSRFNSPFSLWFLRRNEIWFDLPIPME